MKTFLLLITSLIALSSGILRADEGSDNVRAFERQSSLGTGDSSKIVSVAGCRQAPVTETEQEYRWHPGVLIGLPYLHHSETKTCYKYCGTVVRARLESGAYVNPDLDGPTLMPDTQSGSAYYSAFNICGNSVCREHIAPGDYLDANLQSECEAGLSSYKASCRAAGGCRVSAAPHGQSNGYRSGEDPYSMSEPWSPAPNFRH